MRGVSGEIGLEAGGRIESCVEKSRRLDRWGRKERGIMLLEVR